MKLVTLLVRNSAIPMATVARSTGGISLCVCVFLCDGLIPVQGVLPNDYKQLENGRPWTELC
jgi:hypothetical protein